MKSLSPQATVVFLKLVDGLGRNNSRKIDNTNGTFMTVHVEQIGQNRYSIAHYFTQEGDLCCDPDMEFVLRDGMVFPVTFQQAIPPIYQDGSEDARLQSSLVEFANGWMANIKEQQGL